MSDPKPGTFGELFERLHKCRTKDDARRLLESELDACPWIIKDVEYYCGYLDKKEANRIWNLFKDADMNAWYRLGVYEAKHGAIGVAPFAVARLMGIK